MTANIFISYRRADSQEVTGRLFDRLVDCFGPQSVFRDVDSIPLGVPFPDVLSQTLSRTDLVLVVIGPSWLTVTDETGEARLSNSGDFVRLEVESALNRGIPVIPVLVSNAELPTADELPESIASLANRNSYSARPDPDFHQDVDRLCAKIQEVLGLPSEAVRRSETVAQQLGLLTKQNTHLMNLVELQNRIRNIDSEISNLATNSKDWQGKLPSGGKVFQAWLPALGSIVASLVIWLTPDFRHEIFDFGRFVFPLAAMGTLTYAFVVSTAYNVYVTKSEELQRRRGDLEQELKNLSSIEAD